MTLANRELFDAAAKKVYKTKLGEYDRDDTTKLIALPPMTRAQEAFVEALGSLTKMFENDVEERLLEKLRYVDSETGNTVLMEMAANRLARRCQGTHREVLAVQLRRKIDGR